MHIAEYSAATKYLLLFLKNHYSNINSQTAVRWFESNPRASIEVDEWSVSCQKQIDSVKENNNEHTF